MRKLDLDEEIRRAHEERMSDAAIRYLVSSARTDAGDLLFYCLAGWADAQTGKAGSGCEVRDGSDLQACRRVLKAPEFAGLIDEMARLGPGWEAVAQHWDALCELQDEERESRRGILAGATEGSIRAVVLDAVRRRAAARFGEDPVARDVMALIVEQHPQFSNGWQLDRVWRGPVWIGDKKKRDGCLACVPEGHLLATLVAFGRPQALVVARQ